MTDLDPAMHIRRSPIYRKLLEIGACFVETESGVVATRTSETATIEAEQARHLGLSDLTLCPRAGYKGWAAIDWARELGIIIGEQNNRTYSQSDSTRVVRLSDNEFLIPGELSGSSPAIDMLSSARRLEGVYSVPRADNNCRFVICGNQTPAMVAKLCGVDLRVHRFHEGNVAQTSVARLNAIIIRSDFRDVPAYELIADIASAGYMWNCLMDAMSEFGGCIVGTSALCVLKGT